MRIWIMTSEFPPFPGGIARYTDNYARLLGSYGHDVTVFARTSQNEERDLAPNVHLVGIQSRSDLALGIQPDKEPDQQGIFPYNILPFHAGLSFEFAEKILQYLKDHPAPDFIESSDYAALPYYLLQRKLTERSPLDNIPIAITLHGPMFAMMRGNQAPRYRIPDYWIGEMEKFCLLSADVLISTSHFLVKEVEREMRQPVNAAVVPAPLFFQRKVEPHYPKNRDIIFTGRLQFLKGVLPLIKACAKLWQEGEDFRLVMLGGDTHFDMQDIPMSEFIKRRYGKWINSGNLVLAGVVPFEQVIEKMEDALAIAVPSLWENFPNVCIEAMALGKVVLASNTGGQAEMIAVDGENGFIFNWDDTQSLPNQLRKVVHLENEERIRIGHNAQARIRSYCDPQTVVDQHLNIASGQVGKTERRQFPVLYNQNRSEKILALRAAEKLKREYIPGLVSVVIPFYNLGAYVDDTLQSVLQSTYPHLEVLIIDDGSTDPESLAVLDRIEKTNYPNVSVIHKENQGLAATRNFGAAAAHGEYVAFVDADDQIEPDYYQRAVQVFERYENVSFVYSWLRYFDAAKGMWPTWNAQFPYLLAHNMATSMSVVRRLDFLAAGQNKPEIEYAMEDYEGWLSLFSAGGAGVSLPFPLARYRVRPSSMWRSTNTTQLFYLGERISENHPEEYQEWGVEINNLLNQNGPSLWWDNPGTPPAGFYISSQVAIPGITIRDYVIGGKFINMLRKTFPMKYILRSKTLKTWGKNIAKKVLINE